MKLQIISTAALSFFLGVLSFFIYQQHTTIPIQTAIKNAEMCQQANMDFKVLYNYYGDKVHAVLCIPNIEKMVKDKEYQNER